MDLKRFKQIEDRYGCHASWAYWSLPRDGEGNRAGVGDLSIFDAEQNQELFSTLHTNYALIGLNASRKGSDDTSRAFANFHDGGPRGRDYRLRYALRDTPFWGAYLTDFFVDLIDPSATNVMRYVRANPKEVVEQVNERRGELESVGAGSATLVALGNNVHHLLTTYFADRKIIKIPHYSAYIKLEQYRESVRDVVKNKED